MRPESRPGLLRNNGPASTGIRNPKAFRGDELEVAKSLDRHTKYVWVRNKDRLDYGIALPVKSGSSSTFYPDFLWWVKKTVWAIYLTRELHSQRKDSDEAFVLSPPLKVALLTRGKLNANYSSKAEEGGAWSDFAQEI